MGTAVRRACSVLALTAVVVTGLGACGRDDPEEAANIAKQTPRSSSSSDEQCPNGGRPPECTHTTSSMAPASTTPPPTEAPTTTEAPPPPPPPTTTTAPPPPPPAPEPEPPAPDGLGPGASGDAVLALQNRLVELGYWLGDADGGYGLTTSQAVLAFQKAEGLGRDGVAGPDTMAQLAVAGRPAATAPDGNMIEIDLSRQLLFVIRDSQVVWVFNTSTGKSSTPTPPGDFVIDRQVDGYRHAELGVLYRPKYFNEGIAIHGYTSIPGYPASHGCTRVSNAAMDFLWASGYAEIGTRVWVH